MQNTIWQYENKEQIASFKATACFQKTHIQVGINQGIIVSHHMHQVENCEAQHSINFGPQFDLAPLAFASQFPANHKPVSQFLFAPGIVINCYQSAMDNVLPAILLYLNKQSNQSHNCTVYLSSSHVVVVFTHLGQIMLANSFAITDLQETIFYLSSIANQHGLSTADIEYSIYTSLPEIEVRARLADYLPNIQFPKAILPYSLDKMPIFPMESYLISLIPQCALPEAI